MLTFSGAILTIHIAEIAGMEMDELQHAKLIPGVGIEGDRYALGHGFYSSLPDIREITLIQQEALDAIEQEHGIILLPEEHRRNLTTRGVPLNQLVDRQFNVGNTILEGGRLNEPCKYLETLIDKKVFKPLLNRSGLNCRIIKGGIIHPGDVIEPVRQ